MPRASVLGGAALLLGVAFAFALSGCPEERPDPRCGSDGTCLPGFQCVNDFCVPCEGDECDNTVVEGIGEAGGTVCLEPDGVCIDVPPGALSSPVDITIRRARAGVGADDLILVARAYVIGPAGTRFSSDATIRIPIDPSEPFEEIDVYRSEAIGEPWERLDGQSSAMEVQGLTEHLSLFTAAKPKPPVNIPDSGLPDQGVDSGPPDTGFVGAEPWDSGQTPLDSGFEAETGPRDARDPIDSGIRDREAPPEDSGITDIEAPRSDTGATDAEAPRDDTGTADATPPSSDSGSADATSPGMEDTGTADATAPGMEDTGTADASEPGMSDSGTADANEPSMGDSGTSDATDPMIEDSGTADAEDPVGPGGDSGSADADDDPAGPGEDGGGGPGGPGDEDGGGPPGPGGDA